MKKKIIKKKYFDKELGAFHIEMRYAKSKQFSGRTLFTDPVHFISTTIWTKLCEIWEEVPELAQQGSVKITLQGIHHGFLYTQTKYGKGKYPLHYKKGEIDGMNYVTIDSGMLAIIPFQSALCLYKKGAGNELRTNKYPKIKEFHGRVRVQNCNVYGPVKIYSDKKVEFAPNYMNYWN